MCQSRPAEPLPPPTTDWHAHTTARIDHPKLRLDADGSGVHRRHGGKRQDGRSLVDVPTYDAQASNEAG